MKPLYTALGMVSGVSAVEAFALYFLRAGGLHNTIIASLIYGGCVVPILAKTLQYEGIGIVNLLWNILSTLFGFVIGIFLFNEKIHYLQLIGGAFSLNDMRYHPSFAPGGVSTTTFGLNSDLSRQITSAIAAEWKQASTITTSKGTTTNFDVTRGFGHEDIGSMINYMSSRGGFQGVQMGTLDAAGMHIDQGAVKENVRRMAGMARAMEAAQEVFESKDLQEVYNILDTIGAAPTSKSGPANTEFRVKQLAAQAHMVGMTPNQYAGVVAGTAGQFYNMGFSKIEAGKAGQAAAFAAGGMGLPAGMNLGEAAGGIASLTGAALSTESGKMIAYLESVGTGNLSPQARAAYEQYRNTGDSSHLLRAMTAQGQFIGADVYSTAMHAKPSQYRNTPEIQAAILKQMSFEKKRNFSRGMVRAGASPFQADTLASLMENPNTFDAEVARISGGADTVMAKQIRAVAEEERMKRQISPEAESMFEMITGGAMDKIQATQAMTANWTAYGMQAAGHFDVNKLTPQRQVAEGIASGLTGIESAWEALKPETKQSAQGQQKTTKVVAQITDDAGRNLGHNLSLSMYNNADVPERLYASESVRRRAEGY